PSDLPCIGRLVAFLLGDEPFDVTGARSAISWHRSNASGERVPFGYWSAWRMNAFDAQRPHAVGRGQTMTASGRPVVTLHLTARGAARQLGGDDPTTQLGVIGDDRDTALLDEP